MRSFEIQCNGLITIEDFEQGFKKWMSAIDIDSDGFAVKSIPGFDTPPCVGKLEVTYGDKLLFDVIFYRKYRRNNGRKSVCAMITIGVQDEGRELMIPGDKLQLNIDNRMGVNYKGKHTNIVDALQDVLPVRDDDQVKRIADVLNVSPDHVKMDSYQKRYVVDVPLSELQWQEASSPDYFYKYVPLDVFHKMLLYGTFRMNSIVSQSDTQETFYLGDLVCGDYEDEFKRFAGVLLERTVLISSFTTEYENIDMWREYASDGRGVCLTFRLIGKQRLRQVQYVKKHVSSIMNLKKRVEQLREEGIHVHFSVVDDWHRFVKNDNYASEREWRLLVDFDGNVDYDLYENGTRCVSYHDYRFNGRELPELGLRLDSILIGPNQPKGMSNFPMLTERIYKRFGRDITINRSGNNSTNP